MEVPGGMEVDRETRRAAMAFADMLQMLAAAAAPDVWAEKKTYALANTIRKQFTWSPELRKREILHLLGKQPAGGLSVAEIVEITGIKKTTVYNLTRELQAEGRIELRKFPPPGGMGGRPMIRLAAVKKK